jgi:DNA-binding response OmpR family regulator
MRVLLVGGYQPLVKALKQGLEEEGFAVDAAANGHVGNGEVPAADYDAIVLDLMRPAEAGLSLLRRWRRAGLKTQVLALAAPCGRDDKVRGLTAGADDWLAKPFELEELLARLWGLVRRTHPDTESNTPADCGPTSSGGSLWVRGNVTTPSAPAPGT